MSQTTEFPLPVAIWCSRCGARHIDVGEWATKEKAHHKHLCHACGNVWDACLWGEPVEGPHGGLTRHERHYPTVGVSDQRIIQLARGALRSCLSGIEVMRKPGGRVTDNLIGEATTIEGLCWTVENHDDGAARVGEDHDLLSRELGRALRTAYQINGVVVITVKDDVVCSCPDDPKFCPAHLTMATIDKHREFIRECLEASRETDLEGRKQYLLAAARQTEEVVGSMLSIYRKVRGL
jgi:hypothetical protein